MNKIFADYKKELAEINNRYFSLIVEDYLSVKKRHRFIRDFNHGIYVVKDEFCVGKYSDLQTNRGRCDINNGNIYIKESSFSDFVVVHEFIHRASRNLKMVDGIKPSWVAGIGYSDVNINYVAINEVLTEWYTVQLTGHQKTSLIHPYHTVFPIIYKMLETRGNDEIIKRAFFNGDRDTIDELVESVYLRLGYPKYIYDTIEYIIEDPAQSHELLEQFLNDYTSIV